jgi:hypothetical protein
MNAIPVGMIKRKLERKLKKANCLMQGLRLQGKEEV